MTETEQRMAPERRPTRFLSCQPDAPDGCRWLIMVQAEVIPGPGGGPVLIVESGHKRLADARIALIEANGADAGGAHVARDAHGTHDA